MEVQEIVAELNREIARLQEARALLAGGGAGAVRRGRPAKKSVADAAAPKTRKRRLTPEGRKRISEALKRRWAARRKAQEKTAKK